jgi:hypothetical protein
MAGFVAQQLADWDYWDAATEYAALLKSNTIKDPASELAVVNYLQRAASASAALEYLLPYITWIARFVVPSK